MKCEECLPRIEEYVDGELDGRMTERMEAHLSTCNACALELAELERDAEIYANYQRNIEVTPAQWNIVRARIEQ
ncbi:MAG TPA: zf-HC2 domain-containing protein, partial [Pyrinomonadaceae bacterium]